MDRTAVAIDLGGTFIKYGIVNESGDILWESKVPTEAGSREALVDQLVYCVEEIKGWNSSTCVGIGTPGLVDHTSGKVVFGAPQLPDWENLPLAEMVSSRTGLPTFVDNDANLMGLGEYRFGNNKDLNNLIFLTIGTGIGGAIIINGDLYRGSFFAGGEVGYIPYGRADKTGYWEDFGSTRAMVATYRSLAGISDDVEINGKVIMEKVKSGDSLATKALEEQIDVIGWGIAGLVSVLNPDKIIIGGGISESGPQFISAIDNKLRKYAAPETCEGVVIEAAQLGNKAGFLGAGFFALSRT